jgi:hypothetical protein
MNSPGHRANILKAGYKDVGFGIANSPNYQGTGEETIVVAMYGAATVQAPAAPTPAAPVASPPAVAPAPAPVTPPADAVPTTPVVPTPAPQAPSTTKADQKATTETQNLTSQPVSRIDVLTDGNAQWAALTLSILVTLGAILLVYRHGKMWRRYLLEGEHFLIKHPLYDIAIVAAVVICFLLSRTSGFIH